MIFYSTNTLELQNKEIRNSSLTIVTAKLELSHTCILSVLEINPLILLCAYHNICSPCSQMIIMLAEVTV